MVQFYYSDGNVLCRECGKTVPTMALYTLCRHYEYLCKDCFDRMRQKHYDKTDVNLCEVCHERILPDCYEV
jgi:hypothetical protein